MKKRIFLSLFVLIFLVFVSVFYVFGDMSDEEKCRRFLRDYGWEVESALYDKSQINIPSVFDKVYENYNELQKNSGFDLTPYCGKVGTRYTFVVANYPVDAGEPVYANVICVEGVPIGGDIMTVSLGGFMHGIGENTP